MTRHDNELLITFSADFGLDGFVGTVARTHNIRLKEILKKGALTVKRTKTRLLLTSDKIRFHGCQAVRHDDHIHVQLK